MLFQMGIKDPRISAKFMQTWQIERIFFLFVEFN